MLSFQPSFLLRTNPTEMTEFSEAEVDPAVLQGGPGLGFVSGVPGRNVAHVLCEYVGTMTTVHR